MLGMPGTYVALFFWSFLAASIAPLASEPMLIVAVRSRQEFLMPVLIATAGNYLGACSTYWLARGAATRFQAIGRLRDRHAARVLTRYGPPALLLSWVPLVGDAIVALAGAMRVNFIEFSLWTALGKGARYAAVAWLTSQL